MALQVSHPVCTQECSTLFGFYKLGDGLDAHDVGNFDPLSVGQVITMEPGIYIPAGNDYIDKKYWNLSVRIEDDVLVTENGYKILSDCIPRQPNGIEKLMKEKGLGNLPLDR